MFIHTHVEKDGAADDVEFVQGTYRQPGTLITRYLHAASLKNSYIGAPRLTCQTRTERSHAEEQQTPLWRGKRKGRAPGATRPSAEPGGGDTLQRLGDPQGPSNATETRPSGIHLLPGSFRASTSGYDGKGLTNSSLGETKALTCHVC